MRAPNLRRAVWKDKQTQDSKMASFREPSSTSTSMGNDPNRGLTGRTDLHGQSEEALDQAQKMATERINQLQSMIRKNPLAAAGIAAGVGFMLALLARR